jgi:hypothetical protein
MSAPSAFASLLTVPKRLDQPFQHLGRGFKHRLESRLINLLDGRIDMDEARPKWAGRLLAM